MFLVLYRGLRGIFMIDIFGWVLVPRKSAEAYSGEVLYVCGEGLLV